MDEYFISWYNDVTSIISLADWKVVHKKISNCLAKPATPSNHLKSEHPFTSVYLALTGASSTTMNPFLFNLQGLGIEFCSSSNTRVPP